MFIWRVTYGVSMHFWKTGVSVETAGGSLVQGTLVVKKALGTCWFWGHLIILQEFPWICAEQLDNPETVQVNPLGQCFDPNVSVRQAGLQPGSQSVKGTLVDGLSKKVVSEHHSVADWEVTRVLAISLHWIQDGKSSHLWIMPITKGTDLEVIKIINAPWFLSDWLISL